MALPAPLGALERRIQDLASGLDATLALDRRGRPAAARAVPHGAVSHPVIARSAASRSATVAPMSNAGTPVTSESVMA